MVWVWKTSPIRKRWGNLVCLAWWLFRVGDMDMKALFKYLQDCYMEELMQACSYSLLPQRVEASDEFFLIGYLPAVAWKVSFGETLGRIFLFLARVWTRWLWSPFQCYNFVILNGRICMLCVNLQFKIQGHDICHGCSNKNFCFACLFICEAPEE